MNCRIGIRGLSFGSHEFFFELDGSFFEAYESDTVSDAALKVSATVSKEHGRMGLLLDIKGTVTVKCDRCLSDLVLPVNIEIPFTIVFSAYADDDEGSDEVIMLGPDAGELDLGQIIYDYVNLSLPLKKVHEDGGCDPEMMEKLKGILK